MARRPDPERIATARRSAAIARLISAGELPERAAALVARWEAGAGRVRDRTDWEAFDAWLARERGGPT